MAASPTKIGHKNLSGKGGGKTNSGPVSDIGIVKKDGQRRSGSSGGAALGGGGSGSGGAGGAGNDNSASLILEDSFEKYYNKDLDLEEDQVPVVIYELNESAINFISQEQYEKALILLQKAQTMLDQINADKIPCNQFIFLLTLHNMAMCYQKLGILEECSICLEACIDHLESDYLQEYFNDPEQPSLRLKMLKYKCKTHMQICALLSQIHKHREAVFHSNHAIQIAHYLINECKNQCEFYISQLTKKKNSQDSAPGPQSELRIINDKRFSLLEKTAIKILPIMIEMQKKMAIEDYRPFTDGGIYITGPVKLCKGGRGNVSPTRRGNVGPPGAGSKPGEPGHTFASSQPGAGFYDCGKTDMKNILGYLNQSEWMYSLNIGNIMQISPLTLQDFMSNTSIQLELSREFILEKMCFLAVSYFCMGTEYRFLHQLKEAIQDQTFERKDSEYWHGKAVEMAISFLPSESPLVSHILMSYEKHHSPSNMIIPENESQEKYVKVVRQSHGIDSCRLQPIIRHHPDGDYRVPRVDLQKMYWHRIYKTDEYMKTMRMLNKKQLTMTGQYKENNPNSVINRPLKDGKKVGQYLKGNNYTQRIQSTGNNDEDQAAKMKGMFKTSNNKDGFDGEIPGFMLESYHNQLISNGINSDDEIERGSDAEEDDPKQAQSMFYKNNGIQSQDALKLAMNKSDDKNANGTTKHKTSHSQSMGSESKNQRAQPDSQAPLPPTFDKKILQQHRNSLDSEFNNKGNRKLRPAQKKLESDNMNEQNASQSNQKMLLTECLIDGGVQNQQKVQNGSSKEIQQPDQQSSNSLDDIEFAAHKNKDNQIIPNQPGPQGATAGHRRARSSLGVNRKASAKRKGEAQNKQAASGGQQLPNSSQASKGGKKTSNSLNRGAMLSQIRDKNSSSAMAQLQPRNAESGPKIPIHLDDEDMLEGIDLVQNGSTYLQNHQSQPLSVLGSENQLQQVDKPRIGQSQQNMIGSGQTGGRKNGAAPASDANQASKPSQAPSGSSQGKRFKTNPTILNGANGELMNEANPNQDGENQASNTTSQSGQQQFMGKRNQQNQVQQTAPAAGGQRKKQANTINVEELQGASQPQGNTQPQTATVIGTSGSKLNNGIQGNFSMNNHHAGTVRSGSLNNRQHAPQHGANHQNTQQLGNTQLGQLGTAMGSAMGLGPSNNGFVAATANIDQSSKNTINVYQFGSGVNFNLKLAPGSSGPANAGIPNQSQNMSRKQYEQIQNALNSMNSIDRPDRHSNSMDETMSGSAPGASVGLKSQIAQQQPNTLSSKQYPTASGAQSQGNTQTNFNQMAAPATSSKRAAKPSSNGLAPGATTGNSAGSSQRRKNNSQPGSKMPNFNIGNQYLTQTGSSASGSTALPPGSQQNIMQAQNDIIQMMKKRDKMNNSALAQIESGGNSRKFAQSLTGGSGVPNLNQNQVKLYNQKTQKTPSTTGQSQGIQVLDSSQGASGGSATSKTRRQLSNTDKNMHWNNQNLNATGGSSNSNPAQVQGSQRKSSKQASGSGLGQRKTSLEQKFNNSNFGNQQHHRQFSDISHQNLVGYKGIGSNLGGIGESGPSGVSLSSKLQQHQQPTMNEHASMPIMSTQVHGGPRFISQGGGQGPSATSGQITSNAPSSDMITQIPSFIQRQQQQNQNKFQGVGSSATGSNQQKKAQAYLQNQQHQRR